MKRKHFIRNLSLLTGAAIIIPSGIYFATPFRNEIAENIIHDSLNYLKLDKDGVRKFVNDYFSQKAGVIENLRWKYYFVFGKNINDSNVLYEIVRIYLISSDFFTNGMDKNRVVNYSAFYNPYKGKVINPFSRFMEKSPTFSS